MRITRVLVVKALVVPLFGVLLIAPSQRAWSVATPAPTAPQTAPAVAPEDASASQAWKLRLEFKELNLQLVGVATLADQASCFIKSPGTSEQMVYAVGDVIGGFRIAAIDSQSVTFERQSARFQLALGQASGAESPARPALAASGDSANSIGVVVKSAEGNLKTRNTKYATAKLIEDATALNKSSKSDDDEDAPVGRKISGRRGSAFASDFDSPLKGELSSGFGYRRHPLGGGIRYHRGIDLAAPYGTPIRAAASGRVVEVYNSTAHDLGRHIVIKHNDEFETCYGHLSRISVEVGQSVSKGEIIGREGSSGASTGPHLHFEIRRNKEAVNPIPYLHLR